MRNLTTSLAAGGLLALAAACGTAAGPGAGTSAPEPSPEVLTAAARADSVRRSFTAADVEFVRGMIHHHAQALVMAQMAPTHDASPDVRTLARRIINSQRDEIALMQRWLRDHGQPVPEVSESGRMEMDHGGMGQGEHAHDAPLMAGMLTPEQLERLDAARGAEWDRLFLTFMIQHHQGAVVMVEELFGTHGAGQSDSIYKLASDIVADQASEIDRMQRMLRDRVFETGNTS
jgi:uncharacterized protein (DUF305 family)